MDDSYDLLATWLPLTRDALAIVAIIAGGLVAAYEYRRFRRFGAKLQLEVDFGIHPLAGQRNSYLLDVKPVIRNVGSVRHRFPIIQVWVNTTESTDLAKTQSSRLTCSRRMVFEENIVRTPHDPYFVDPGVAQTFPHPIVVADPGELIQVVVRFFYRVSIARYLWLRCVAAVGVTQRWRKVSKRRRLVEHRVDQYHLMSAIKQVPQGGGTSTSPSSHR